MVPSTCPVWRVELLLLYFACFIVYCKCICECDDLSWDEENCMWTTITVLTLILLIGKIVAGFTPPVSTGLQQLFLSFVCVVMRYVFLDKALFCLCAIVLGT